VQVGEDEAAPLGLASELLGGLEGGARKVDVRVAVDLQEVEAGREEGRQLFPPVGDRRGRVEVDVAADGDAVAVVPVVARDEDAGEEPAPVEVVEGRLVAVAQDAVPDPHAGLDVAALELAPQRAHVGEGNLVLDKAHVTGRAAAGVLEVPEP
jgi:hypothetical protein